MKKGYISIVHLIYIIIISVILLAFILVIAFGNTETANTTMGTASTVSSLILSVIAIVMTITDVAGQRNTVSDIKESAEKLQTNLSTVNKSIEEIGQLKEDLMESMRAINVSNQSIIKEISTLKGKYEKNDGEEPKIENQEILKDLNELSERLKTVYVNPIAKKAHFLSMPDNNSDFEDRIILNRILTYLVSHIPEKFKLSDVIWMSEELKISRSRLKSELNKLVNKKILSRDGEYYIIQIK
ncbi:coiled-coil domain-containing protein [Solibacillus sp. FSL K6-1523]|uniref:coiled-coil domain-containing protein n=1 Tax=Solibacillus sp. FSL K6-1523 TaxID=2921471 RepID=UPI0030F86ECE